MPSSRLLWAALLGLGAAAACASGSSPLARRDEVAGASGDGGSAGAAGAGQGGALAGAGQGGSGGQGAGAAGALAGSAGSAGSAAGEAGQGGSAGAAGAAGTAGVAGGPPIVIEPDGPPEFRFLNGVTSAPAIKLCWLAPGSEADAPPQPEGSTLLYGSSMIPAAPPGVDPAAEALQPHIITGDLGKVGASGCKALLEAPPQGVFVSSLPVLPAATTTAPRSRLAVAVGCAPQGGVVDVNNTCGTGVDLKAGNLNLVLVDLSRIAPDAGQFGLQVVHASTALPSMRVILAPSGAELTATLVPQLSLGQIAPRPPSQGKIDSLFGANVIGAQVRLQDTNGTQLLTFDLGPSLAESGLTADAIAPDAGLVAVILGPKPGSPTDAAPVAPSRLVWFKAPRL